MYVLQSSAGLHISNTHCNLVDGNVAKRKSWDTNVKHYYRLGLEDNLPVSLKALISNTNKYRWRHEPEAKYTGCEVATFVNQEIEFIKRIGQSSKTQKTIEAYFKLCDTLHIIISNIKGLKTTIKEQKELVVNTIESVKGYISIDNALRVFNISRTTYQNYKARVIYKCEASYYKWCTKRFPNQLLVSEVTTIKRYMAHKDYLFWSKVSVYLKAVHDDALSCSLSTFYKYCMLLGFNTKRLKKKYLNYKPVKTEKPNELWCADVTIFKTADGSKHYIHFLMDHFSKLILGYRIENHNSGKAIVSLLREATLKYKPNALQLLTDGGAENINTNVSGFLNGLAIEVKHNIAQKDVLYSNSTIEALNKVIKYQFLFPKQIYSRTQLLNILEESVTTYNKIKPQKSLGGNTPFETFNGVPINFSTYIIHFKQQKAIRILQNTKNACKQCL